MTVDNFTLFSGAPYEYKEIVFRQPKLIEIGKIGQDSFYNYLSYFLLDKTKVLKEGSTEISDIDFVILLILNDVKILENLNVIFNMLADSRLVINEVSLKLELVCEKLNKKIELEDEDWAFFVQYVRDIFCIKGELQYKTQKNKAAQRIADMINKAKKKIAEQKKGKDSKNVLEQYCSIVSTGSHIPLNEIINEYTLYQLLTQLKRLTKYEDYHIQIEAMMHGATEVKLQNWMGDVDEVTPAQTNSKDKKSYIKMR